MNIYADSKYPVADNIAAVHAEQILGLGAPGTWWTGAERLAMAQLARKAANAVGVLDVPDDGDEEVEADLPDVVRRVVEILAVAPKDIDYEFYQQALADGLSDAEYVEIVGVVARATCFDVFARGIGVLVKPLPVAQDGEPACERPSVAVQELAWMPTIPIGEAGGELGKELFKGRPLTYIFRGVSLVPDEFRAHIALEQEQYVPLSKIFIADYQHHDGLTRAQAELVAARVSALNECFY